MVFIDICPISESTFMEYFVYIYSLDGISLGAVGVFTKGKGAGVCSPVHLSTFILCSVGIISVCTWWVL